MRSFFTGLFIFVMGASLFVAYLCVFIVDESQTALVIRFGEIQRTVDEPGLKFKYPVDDVIFIDRRIIYLESNDLRVLVEDNRFYEVDAVTMYKIVDIQKFRETVGADRVRAEDRIGTRLEAALRQTYGKRTFQAALSEDRGNMMNEIREQVKTDASSLGIEIVDVRIRRTDLGDKVLENTFARMRQERLAEAEQIRAVGRAESDRIRAEAKREAVEMEAKAQRESEIIRGQGDAERNKIFADAFTRDPEFFSFYRSMLAYRNSLENGNTNLVLTPDSEFFRYLRDPDGAAKPK